MSAYLEFNRSEGKGKIALNMTRVMSFEPKGRQTTLIQLDNGVNVTVADDYLYVWTKISDAGAQLAKAS